MRGRNTVEWFARHMLQKLAENEHKPHWENETFGALLNKMDAERYELLDAMAMLTANISQDTGDTTSLARDVIRECAGLAGASVAGQSRTRKAETMSVFETLKSAGIRVVEQDGKTYYSLISGAELENGDQCTGEEGVLGPNPITDELDKHKEAFRKLEAMFLEMAEANGVEANEAREMVDHVAVWDDVAFKVDMGEREIVSADPDAYAVKMAQMLTGLTPTEFSSATGLPEPEAVYGYVETFGEMIDEDPPDELAISEDLAKAVYKELAPQSVGSSVRGLLNKIGEVFDV